VPAAHLLAAALCVGLALALLVREAHAGLALAAGGIGLLAVFFAPSRVPLLAVALVLAGIWWGSARLEALDSSVLEQEKMRWTADFLSGTDQYKQRYAQNIALVKQAMPTQIIFDSPDTRSPHVQ